ncbi:hypothetical protein A2U01_0113070, partial [Trifolium medium]|nr:hypothetical protein [Trifolium medium]
GSRGSIGEYCVRHCICPVVFVRYSDENDAKSEDVISTANSVVGNFAAEN